jgi:hypothetical protein
MEVLFVEEREIKSITEFLLEKRFVFHPVISPNGIMDFTPYGNRDYVLLLDRNLLTKMIEFFKKGTINDAYIRKVIASIMFWAHANHISLNSGLALNEYANCSGDNSIASAENSIFLKAMKYYHPKIWLSIAMGRREGIEPLPCVFDDNYSFNINNEHQLMHMSEMLCITRLYFDKLLSPVEKMVRFLEWNYKNLLICQYTIVYAMFVFSDRTKVYKKANSHCLDDVLRICRNQAWDITYLSDWSTLYWDDINKDSVYLFATMDKELKQLFTETHDTKSNLFYRFFNESDAMQIEICFDNLRMNRKKPIMNTERIMELYENEYRLTESTIKNIG